jgi:hypothetical protein
VRTGRAWAIEKISALASVTDSNPASAAKVGSCPWASVGKIDGGYSGFRRSEVSFRCWSEETSGAEPSRLVVPLLLDEREILGDIFEGLKDRRERNLIFPGEFFGCEGIRTMDGVSLGLFVLDCQATICSKRSQVLFGHSLEEGDRANCSIHIEAVVREDATL